MSYGDRDPMDVGFLYNVSPGDIGVPSRDFMNYVIHTIKTNKGITYNQLKRKITNNKSLRKREDLGNWDAIEDTLSTAIGRLEESGLITKVDSDLDVPIRWRGNRDKGSFYGIPSNLL